MSDSPKQESIKDVFLQAIEIDDVVERQRFVALACQSNEPMRKAVERLMASHHQQEPNRLDDLVDCLGVGETQWTSTRSGIWPETFKANQMHRIDRYSICELIGEGGMGSVFVAQQEQPVRRKVALKIIRAEIATKEALARFSAERQALAMMDHPCIAKVLDGGATESGQPYLVMELVQGTPITEYASHSGLSIEQRLRLFQKVCHAVQHAHRKGVIHRDLKPSNILVAEIDGEALPKVIDFGLAKALDQPLTDITIHTGFAQLMGTPMYMSPEQAEMGTIDIDTRSDVYSLGVLLYELMVGAPPFDRETFKTASFDEVRRIIREIQPPRPSVVSRTLSANENVNHQQGDVQRKLHPSIRGELDWLIMKTMEKDRRRRYGSASELAEDIQRYLTGQTVLACPPSPIYQFRKTVSRHRFAIAVSSVVLVSLVMTSIISTWKMLEVRQAKSISEARERQANELLECNQLQQAVSAYQAGDLLQLSQLTKIVTHPHALPSSSRVTEQSALSHFFRAAATPVPNQCFKTSSAIHEIAISSKRKAILCACEDGSVVMFPLDGSTTAGRSLGRHDEPVHAVSFSSDGSMAVSGSTSGLIKFWDVEKTICIHQVRPVENGIESLAWSPDGRSVAAGFRYAGVWVGDANGNEKFRLINDHRHETLLFTPDSQELLVPTRDGIHVWDVSAARHDRTIETDPFTNVRAMCWAGPNQQWLIAGERYFDSLAVFDRETGARRGTFNVSASYAKSLAASSNGMWLTAGYGDGRIQIIRLHGTDESEVGGEVRTQWNAYQQDDKRLAVGWLEDDPNQFITAGHDGTAQRWDLDGVVPKSEFRSPVAIEGAYLLDDKPDPVLLLRGQEPTRLPVEKMSLRAEEGLVALRSDNQISIVSLRTRQTLTTIDSPPQRDEHLALSSDGSRLVAVGGGFAFVWESVDRWVTHELIASFTAIDNGNAVFANHNQTLICGTADEESLQELNIKSGEVDHQYRISHPRVVAISNDERQVAIGNDQRLTVWDRKTDQVFLDIREMSRIWSLRFLADDRVLISGHNDGRIMAWHVPTGQPLGTLYHPRPGLRRPQNLQLSGDGRRMLLVYPSEHGYVPVLLGR
ncbi:serine/threonine protein kinase [Rhodopirellula baltica SH28]|uniref:Serine/threonine protein kinase n=1 Tax=Rhodopirellula baltica SH28 TaxID=993517 RepID=K5C9A6_RHOBT|nr:serine/threonine-protein kinase [Rhodopirellula baltica]EKJ99689.1 serine/threonine protein kinase [Rhodopirellula baltica SH28]